MGHRTNEAGISHPHRLQNLPLGVATFGAVKVACAPFHGALSAAATLSSVAAFDCKSCAMCLARSVAANSIRRLARVGR